MNVAFFDAKPYDVESFSPLEGKDGLHFKFYETKLNADTAELARGCETVCSFVNDDVSALTIDRLCDLGVKLIALRCAGFNHVDISHAYGRIHVVRVPAYSPYAIAEHAMAMLLTIVRRTHKSYLRTRDHNFSLVGLTGFDLHGKTVGVIGAGRIGRAFMDICRGFGMKILATDRNTSPIDSVTFTDLDTLLSEADVISLHCPLTAQTHHMIDAAAIEKMKKGVTVINTSRGALIDAEALLAGIKQRKIGAACLDVYEEESDLFFEDRSGHIMDDDVLARLISMPNVLVTSHQAFLTEEALGEIAKATAENIRAFFAGEPTPNEICYHCERIDGCRKQRAGKCF